MTEQLGYDDLIGHARAFWRIAPDMCTCGSDYHRVHPLLRASGMRPGIVRDRGLLNPWLPDLVEPGCRLLIAGSADASLLAYFIDDCPTRPIAVTIADLCPAPLEVIRRLALPDGISVETRQADLASLEGVGPFDLILSHHMLTFVDIPTRVALLSRLRASLAPHGRLVLVMRMFGTDTLSSAAERIDGAVKIARAALSKLPDLVADCGPDLDGALHRYFQQHAGTRAQIEDASELIDLIERAGLRVERRIEGSREFWETMPDGSERTRKALAFVAMRS